MISFIIDFENSLDRSRFLSSIDVSQNVSVYSVTQGNPLSISLICKTFSDGLKLVTVVDNLLKSLEIDVRPFSFCYSEFLN